MWNTLRRWRTWIVNALAGVLIILPEILQALAGYNWGGIVPAEYLPYVSLAVVILNIAMRPHPAVLPNDPEAEVTRKRRQGTFRGVIE